MPQTIFMLSNPKESTETMNRKCSYGQGVDALSMHKEIGTFNPVNSAAYITLIHYFGTTIKLRELKGIIMSLVTHLEKRHNIKLMPMSRNTKRSYTLLIKYFQDNIHFLAPLLPLIRLYNSNGDAVEFHDSPYQQCTAMAIPTIASSETNMDAT